MTARKESRWGCRARSPTCSPTAPRASRSAWRPRSRRTMRPSCAMPRSISSIIPMRRAATSSNSSPARPSPAGGITVAPPAEIAEAYVTGRGSFRVRARWTKEEGGRGTWQVVITEIPYGVQKSRLIEQLANLLNEKKLPLLADVRDESTDDVRIVLEPRSRTVEPETMMESLFKLSELESRVSMNMNVLVDGVVPRVVGLNEALRQWLDHRRDVLLRRSRHRLAAIDRRLEMLAG